jgi:hypothetical protein
MENSTDKCDAIDLSNDITIIIINIIIVIIIAIVFFSIASYTSHGLGPRNACWCRYAKPCFTISHHQRGKYLPYTNDQCPPAFGPAKRQG